MSDTKPPAFGPACNGICLTAGDIGLGGNEIAYPHPTCPAHGADPGHPFEHASTDGHGHELCGCGGVRETHAGQTPCTHESFGNGRCRDCGITRTTALFNPPHTVTA